MTSNTIAVELEITRCGSQGVTPGNPLLRCDQDGGHELPHLAHTPSGALLAAWVDDEGACAFAIEDGGQVRMCTLFRHHPSVQHLDWTGAKWRADRQNVTHVLVSFEVQLAGRVAELLPDQDGESRLELLNVMDPDDLRTSLAWLISYAPRTFDYALVRDRALVEQLQERLDEADAYEDDLEPYCAACGGAIGIFAGHGDGWHHYRGNRTPETPNELFDAGHEPTVAWREAGAQ
jgi:hypothetical protein